MAQHQLSTLLPQFDRASYAAGITTAFAEVVAMGCKHLALSPVYAAEELAAMLAVTERIVAEHRLLMLVEPELLITPLFPADVASGQTVILIAREQATLDTYTELKQWRMRAIAEQRLAAIEIELAWRFGRLLSYADDAIQQLITENLPSTLKRT